MAEAKKPAQSREAKLRARAKTSGFKLETQGNGWQLVDAVTGTLVTADWNRRRRPASLSTGSRLR